jgi:hypothetical protein
LKDIKIADVFCCLKAQEYSPVGYLDAEFSLLPA